MIGRRRLDIPLARDGSGRFLPWLIAPMVYLAGLALAGMLTLNGALANWDRGLAGTLTIEIPAPPDSQKGDGGFAATLAVLQATPGIVAMHPLDRAQVSKLLKPWLGDAVSPEELPLPRLVDLRIAPGGGFDLAGLKSRLAGAAPGAIVDDHHLWLDRLYDLMISVEATALAIVILIGATAVLTVVFTTRAGLAVHHEVIELLHLMGARDGYVAHQFEREALRLGLGGGIIGLALAALTLVGLGHAAAATGVLGEQAKLLPELHLTPWQWATLLALPPAAGIAAMLTARLTVLRALTRLP
jgi:cell division transport system permease protein